MPTAVIQNRVVTNSAPPYVITLWSDTEGVAANSDSTSLIILDIPGIEMDEPSYRQTPRKNPGGNAYAIELVVFNISCVSTDFNVRILNQNNANMLNTIYEVGRYNNINLSNIDSAFDRFVIRNRDGTLSSRLYLYIENNDIINATGTISLEMIYIIIQDRAF